MGTLLCIGGNAELIPCKNPTMAFNGGSKSAGGMVIAVKPFVTNSTKNPGGGIKISAAAVSGRCWCSISEQLLFHHFSV